MTVSFEHKKWYVTCTEDCGENEGGYFCQVYDIDDEVKGECEGLDEFCIHPEELLKGESNLELLVKSFIDIFYGNETDDDFEKSKKWNAFADSQIALKKQEESLAAQN